MTIQIASSFFVMLPDCHQCVQGKYWSCFVIWFIG